MSDLLPLIDTHCHLQYDYSPRTIDELIEDAKKSGITSFVTVGTDLASSREMAKFSEQYVEVYHSVGVHPHDANTVTEEVLKELENLSSHSKCRAIGEIGLDWHYMHSTKEEQMEGLERQLALALKVEKPVIIHSREAEEELLPKLVSFAKSRKGSKPAGVLHCFTGTYEFAKKCVEVGFYVSFSGILTFKNAEAIRETAKALPSSVLLVETDSPYLAPIPFRGKKCEPSMVQWTAMKLAEIRGIEPLEIARITTQNANELFGRLTGTS